MLCNCYDKFDFSARWITLKGADEINASLEFFTRFDVPVGAEKILRIAAESCYVLYVNGIFIGKGPVRGTWNIDYFDAYDLSGVLREKDNIIAVRIQSMNDLKNFNYHPAGCAVLAEIPGVLTSDGSWSVRRTLGWIATETLYSGQQGRKLEFDFSQADERWFMGDSDVGKWEKAKLSDSVALAAKRLLPRGIPPLKQSRMIPVLHSALDMTPDTVADGEDIADLLDRAELTPSARVSGGKDNIYRIAPNGKDTVLIYDFKDYATGSFDLTVTVNEPDVELHITIGEEIWRGRVRSAFRRDLDHAFFVDSFHLKQGKNHITNEFLAHGGTMMQLAFRNASKDIIVAEPSFIDRRYPWQAGMSFSCSDLLLNDIFDACVRTMSACSTDTFEDGPWREHSFWVNDLVVENIAAAALFGISDLHRRSFELLFAQQYDNGWCPGVVPAEHRPEDPVMILVPTNFFLFTIMDDYYRESGDKETVRDYLPNLKKILDLAESLCKDDGLIQPPDKMWNFFDWGYELNNITFSRKGGTMLNSLYITAMKLFSRLCRITDTPFDKNILDQRIARISKGLQRFISAENGLPVDPASKIEMPKRTFSDTELTSELSMAFALQSGVWDSDSEKRFIDAIISGKYLAPELYLQAVIFDELSKRGLADEALARIRRYWGQFIKIGRKTIPESGIHLIGRTGYWENASYCHGFTTHPAVFFRREILGIRDIDNGFAEFVFAPQSFDLEYASGSVVTPHGEIRVAWQRQDDKMDVELSLPCGVTAALVDGRKFSAGTHRFSLP